MTRRGTKGVALMGIHLQCYVLTIFRSDLAQIRDKAHAFASVKKRIQIWYTILYRNQEFQNMLHTKSYCSTFFAQKTCKFCLRLCFFFLTVRFQFHKKKKVLKKMSKKFVRFEILLFGFQFDIKKKLEKMFWTNLLNLKFWRWNA